MRIGVSRYHNKWLTQTAFSPDPPQRLLILQLTQRAALYFYQLSAQTQSHEASKCLDSFQGCHILSFRHVDNNQTLNLFINQSNAPSISIRFMTKNGRIKAAEWLRVTCQRARTARSYFQCFAAKALLLRKIKYNRKSSHALLQTDKQSKNWYYDASALEDDRKHRQFSGLVALKRKQIEYKASCMRLELTESVTPMVYDPYKPLELLQAVKRCHSTMWIAHNRDTNTRINNLLGLNIVEHSLYLQLSPSEKIDENQSMFGATEHKTELGETEPKSFPYQYQKMHGVDSFQIQEQQGQVKIFESSSVINSSCKDFCRKVELLPSSITAQKGLVASVAGYHRRLSQAVGKANQHSAVERRGKQVHLSKDEMGQLQTLLRAVYRPSSINTKNQLLANLQRVADRLVSHPSLLEVVECAHNHLSQQLL